METKEKSVPYWHFDKVALSAAVAIFLAILTQTGSLIWWISKVSATIAEQERRLTNVELDGKAALGRNGDIARMDERIISLSRRIEHIEAVTRQP